MRVPPRFINLAKFAYVCFLFFWLCNWLWLVIDRAVAGQLSYTKVDKILKVTDYMHFYRAGHMVMSSDRSHLYESQMQQQWLQKLVYPEKVSTNMDNQNVPYFLICMAPFALLPINASQVVWDFLSFAVGALCLFYLWKEMRKESVKNFYLLLIGALASFAGFQTFYTGQTTWWVLATMSMYFLNYWRGKDLNAGFFLATLIKIQYLPFLIIIPVAQRRFRVVLSFLGTLAVFLILSACVLGPQTVLDYPHYLLNVEGHTDVGAQRMICLRTLFDHILPSSYALVVAFVCTVLSLATVFFIWWKGQGKDRSYFVFSVAATLLIALIASPHCFAMDVILLLIACVLTLPDLLRELSSIEPRPLRTYTYLFIACPVLSWLIYLSSFEQAPINCLSYLIIHITLLVCAVRCLILAGQGALPRTGD